MPGRARLCRRCPRRGRSPAGFVGELARDGAELVVAHLMVHVIVLFLVLVRDGDCLGLDVDDARVGCTLGGVLVVNDACASVWLFVCGSSCVTIYSHVATLHTTQL
jgi:hypothetical protein